ncbi:MAG: ribonuclease III [Bacteroidota bacterium]
MSLFPKKLSGSLLSPFKSEKKLRQSFKLITGLAPVNLALYKQAMRHSSVANMTDQGIKDSYERLEYLGDAIIGMMVAEHLFAQYPFEEEGFLTVIRAKIVNRESLSRLAQKIGLRELVQYNQGQRRHRSVYGDCMEALIGAVYLDHGFHSCRKFVVKRLIQPHYDLDELISTITNYKSKLLEWSQKENKELRFEIIDEDDKKFTAQVFLNDEPMAIGFGFSKKKAEQDAAGKTYIQLNLDT